MILSIVAAIVVVLNNFVYQITIQPRRRPQKKLEEKPQR